VIKNLGDYTELPLPDTDSFIYVILGNTKYEDLLQEVLGYLVGFVFVAIGFWKWMPAIRALRQEKTAFVITHGFV